MSALTEFLQQVAGTGEQITIAYGGGSRPGEPRPLYIIACSESEFKAYEGDTRHVKTYKIPKVLWAEDSAGNHVTNEEEHLRSFRVTLPKFESLEEYAAHLRPEFEKAGWHIHSEPNLFGVGVYFKNGKPKKTPSVAIRYFDPKDEDDAFYTSTGMNDASLASGITGRERPWRVDSWRFKEGKTFKKLHAAMEVFVHEVRASDPKEAKGMFAGQRH
jgi:hypothetical protein